MLLSALGLGIAVDALTNAHGPGIGLALALTLIAAAIAALHGRLGLTLPSRERWVFVAAFIALALVFAYRSSPNLLWINAWALFVTFVMLSIRVYERRLLQVRFGEFALAVVELPLFGIVRACGAIGRVFPQRDTGAGFLDGTSEPASARFRHSRDILIGVAIALPVLILFTALLAAADAGFHNLVAKLFRWDVSDAVTHIIVIGAASLGVAAVLISALASVPLVHQPEKRTTWASGTVVWIVLGSIVVLFATFIALQAGYLFGGAAYLEQRAHLTAAQYARRGFFQLLAVAALVVPVLLVFRRWYADSDGARRAYRTAGPMLALLTLGLIGSAMARLWIYQDRFGLTMTRVNAAIILLWLALGLIWMGVRIARLRAPHLTAFAAATGIGLILVMDLVNPARLVASTNLRHADQHVVDVPYLVSLGADAVPTLVGGQQQLDHWRREQLQRLIERHGTYADHDWRNWNHARSRADAARTEMRPIGSSRHDR